MATPYEGQNVINALSNLLLSTYPKLTQFPVYTANTRLSALSVVKILQQQARNDPELYQFTKSFKYLFAYLCHYKPPLSRSVIQQCFSIIRLTVLKISPRLPPGLLKPLLFSLHEAIESWTAISHPIRSDPLISFDLGLLLQSIQALPEHVSTPLLESDEESFSSAPVETPLHPLLVSSERPCITKPCTGPLLAPSQPSTEPGLGLSATSQPSSEPSGGLSPTKQTTLEPDVGLSTPQPSSGFGVELSNVPTQPSSGAEPSNAPMQPSSGAEPSNAPMQSSSVEPFNAPMQSSSGPGVESSNDPTQTNLVPSVGLSTAPTQLRSEPVVEPSNAPTQTSIEPGVEPSNAPTQTSLEPDVEPSNAHTQTNLEPSVGLSATQPSLESGVGLSAMQSSLEPRAEGLLPTPMSVDSMGFANICQEAFDAVNHKDYLRRVQLPIRSSIEDLIVRFGWTAISQSRVEILGGKHEGFVGKFSQWFPTFAKLRNTSNGKQAFVPMSTFVELKSFY